MCRLPLGTGNTKQRMCVFNPHRASLFIQACVLLKDIFVCLFVYSLCWQSGFVYVGQKLYHWPKSPFRFCFERQNLTKLLKSHSVAQDDLDLLILLHQLPKVSRIINLHHQDQTMDILTVTNISLWHSAVNWLLN